MVTGTTFKSITKGRSITFLEIIHQGNQDIIIFHIQNEKLGVNGETFSMFGVLDHSKTVENPGLKKTQ